LYEVTLGDVDGTALSQIVDFAYSGTLDITPDNVTVLLETANYLDIDVICKACCDYVYCHVDIDNVIDVLKLSSTFNCTELYNQVTCYLLVQAEPTESKRQSMHMQ
jgi:BTB/POZ domain